MDRPRIDAGELHQRQAHVAARNLQRGGAHGRPGRAGQRAELARGARGKLRRRIRREADGIAVEGDRTVQIGDGVNDGVRAHDPGGWRHRRLRRLPGRDCGREHDGRGQ